MRARRGRRGRRADVRAAVIGSAGEARRSAQAPRCGHSERSETADAVGRVRSSLPSSGAPHKPAVGGPVREQVVVVVLSAQSARAGPPWPCRPSQKVGDALQHAQSIPDRLPSSDELCWLAAGGELEDPRRASPSLAGPPTRPRPQASKASLLASLPSASMPKDTSQRARRAETDTPWRRASVRWAPAPSARPPRAFAAAAAGGGARA